MRFTLKRSLREPSCCSLLVVNGGAGLRRRSFFSMLRTAQSAFSSAATIFLDSSSLGTSVFSSPRPMKRASKAGGLPPARCASIVQYSFVSNALTSRSRSTIKRRATVWTRPADNAVQHAPCLLRIDEIAVNFARMPESFLYSFLGNFVEGDAVDRYSALFLLLAAAIDQLFGKVRRNGFAFTVRVRRQV